MSFLDKNNSEYLSARITQKGRNAIAKGNFNITYFAIGDSEFVYTNPFSGLTGSGVVESQKVLTPFDKDSQIKYPFKMDSTPLSGTTIFGVPVEESISETIRNVIGPAGFVSNYKPYDQINITGSTVECLTNIVNFNTLTGGTFITVPITTGTTYQNCETISLVLNSFHISGGTKNILSGQTNSLVYKIVSVTTGTTSEILELDRPTIVMTGSTGYANIVCNNCNIEYPNSNDVDTICLPIPPTNEEQHDPWTLNVIWSENPIGFDVSTIDRSVSGFTSSKYISVKEYLGYNTSNGQVYNTGTTYVNSFLEEITVLPEEQKCIAVIHYSEIGDIINDPDRSFKYDDYISGLNSIDNQIAKNLQDELITDTEYFEVYIPFIQYHRNTGTTIGAVFHMDNTDKYLISKINDRHQIKYRDLLDEQNYKVGKVFIDNKLIVFDDQELVAVLDYKSNRRHTLPAPKLNLLPTDTTNQYSLLSGTTGQTLWVTYVFQDTYRGYTNSLPCNYFSKINSSNIPSSVSVKFNVGEFTNMVSNLSDIDMGFIANKFYILVQLVNNNELPNPSSWKKIDFTSTAGGDGNTALNPSNIVNKSFIITKTLYDNAYSQSSFDLTIHTGDDFTENSSTNFGDEQPFNGSIRLVRSTDIETMRFLVNLPNGKFSSSQNPTYTSGNPYITEISLLNDNKETMVNAKTSKPILRTGTQVFGVKLDF